MPSQLRRSLLPPFHLILPPSIQIEKNNLNLTYSCEMDSCKSTLYIFNLQTQWYRLFILLLLQSSVILCYAFTVDTFLIMKQVLRNGSRYLLQLTSLSGILSNLNMHIPCQCPGYTESDRGINTLRKSVQNMAIIEAYMYKPTVKLGCLLKKVLHQTISYQNKTFKPETAYNIQQKKKLHIITCLVTANDQQRRI